MILAFGEPHLTWDLARDLRQLFDFPFMVNAFWAGTIVAIVAALIGWFMVLRAQTFAGHTLAVVGFPGAAGAAFVGVSAYYGYFLFCVAAALVMATVPQRSGSGESEGSALTGITQAFALACGYLFTSLSGGNLNGTTALLFGNFLGITRSQVATLAVVAVVTIAALAAMARPLLFSSLDADVARARGVPVRWLSLAFLILLGLAAAEVSQITGALLVFALLVLPPAMAQAITPRPARSAALAVGLALLVTWFGLAAAYYSPYPIGFWVTTFAFGVYVAGRAVAGSATSWSNRRRLAT